MADQPLQPKEERRLSVSRSEFDQLRDAVNRLLNVVFGSEQIGLTGLLTRMTRIEGGIGDIQKTLEQQEQDRKAELDLLRQTLAQHEKERKAERDKMIFGIQMLLAGMGIQGGALIGRFLGWW